MPVQQTRFDHICVEYAYARSHDSQFSNQPGQDYLEVNGGTSSQGNPKFVFAVCDGVGSSFMGNIAALRVGERLCEKLWGKWKDVIHTDTLARQLTETLEELAQEVNLEIQNYSISDELPALVRTALGKQRTYGSETMFVCGRLVNNRLALAWLGDVRLQVLTEHYEPVNGFVQVPDTNQRWSSREGIRGGNIQTLIIEDQNDLLNVKHILAFSDGLAAYENQLSSMSADEINAAIRQLNETPLSDDISFIHITLHNAE